MRGRARACARRRAAEGIARAREKGGEETRRKGRMFDVVQRLAVYTGIKAPWCIQVLPQQQLRCS